MFRNILWQVKCDSHCISKWFNKWESHLTWLELETQYLDNPMVSKTPGKWTLSKWWLPSSDQFAQREYWWQPMFRGIRIVSGSVYLIAQHKLPNTNSQRPQWGDPGVCCLFSPVEAQQMSPFILPEYFFVNSTHLSSLDFLIKNTVSRAIWCPWKGTVYEAFSFSDFFLIAGIDRLFYAWKPLYCFSHYECEVEADRMS